MKLRRFVLVVVVADAAVSAVVGIGVAAETISLVRSDDDGRSTAVYQAYDPYADYLPAAAAVARLDCSPAPEGSVPESIIVAYTDDGRIELLPFTDDNYERAIDGEFLTLEMCS